VSLLKFALARILSGFLLILASATGVFFAMRLLGNPIEIALEGRVSDEEIARRVEEAGYNRPIWVQYFEYLALLSRGSLGASNLDGVDVLSTILKYLPASVENGLTILLISSLIAIPLGYWLASKRNTTLGDYSRLGVILLYTIPPFLLAVILKIVFTVWIPVLPVSGRISVTSEITLMSRGGTSGFIIWDAISTGSWSVLPDYFSHLLLPMLSIGIVVATGLARTFRVSLLEQFESDWYVEARNNFGNTWRTKWNHLFRPAAAQLVTAIGISTAAIVPGLVLGERVFEIRGLGFLLIQVIVLRDYNTVQGLVIVIALMIILINLLADLIAAILDPRFRKVVK
jgi:peptide/nickel transport system permease protein